MRKPVLVGLCGRSGVGKGYVSAQFGKHGIPTIDTDKVYRDLTAPSARPSLCMRELEAEFGGITNPDNSLNRRALREIVFSDPEALSRLNEISHKHILSRTRELAREMYEEGNPIILIDAPVLYESGFDRECAAVIAVVAPHAVSVERIMSRDGISQDTAEKRLSAQLTEDELRARVDYVIANPGDDSVKSAVAECAAELKRKFNKTNIQI